MEHTYTHTHMHMDTHTGLFLVRMYAQDPVQPILSLAENKHLKNFRHYHCYHHIKK